MPIGEGARSLSSVGRGVLTLQQYGDPDVADPGEVVPHEFAAPPAPRPLKPGSRPSLFLHFPAT
ncbi:hypothetical protein SAMN05216251_101345 [Actinacidiphila alni]|uniref:Uncharacterized protein n=1 Tax=Actinacidiphila alni TaxID=380248 RepID=A0A1I1XEZ6_9ACTN|nr:hypothetical protein SAMN05216251_101345 [Actinacidiphila alni]